MKKTSLPEGDDGRVIDDGRVVDDGRVIAPMNIDGMPGGIFELYVGFRPRRRARLRPAPKPEPGSEVAASPVPVPQEPLSRREAWRLAANALLAALAVAAVVGLLFAGLILFMTHVWL